MKYLAIILATTLVSCATPRLSEMYTGPSFYYDRADGEKMECRNPAPWRGGNCFSIVEWEAKRNAKL